MKSVEMWLRRVSIVGLLELDILCSGPALRNRYLHSLYGQILDLSVCIPDSVNLGMSWSSMQLSTDNSHLLYLY